MTVPLPPPPAVPSQITDVTVFKQHALVVRTATARVGAPSAGGSVRLRVRGLPPSFNQHSLQARCDGSARPTLASLSIAQEVVPTVLPKSDATGDEKGPARRSKATPRGGRSKGPKRTNASPEDARPAPQPEELATAATKLSQRHEVLSASLSVLAGRISTLRTLRALYLARLKSDRGKLDLGEAIAQQLKVDRALEEAIGRKIRLEHQRAAVTRRLAQVRALEKARTPAPAPPSTRLEHVADLELLTRRAGRVTCEIRYLVSGASWRTSYDARMRGGQLHLVHYAWITNRTTESWAGVNLSVSMAGVTGQVALPKNPTWIVRLDGQALLRIGRLRHRRWHRAVASAAASKNPGNRIPAPPPLPQATRVDRQLFAVYTAGRRASVPANGKERRVFLNALKFETELRYLAIPRVSNAAYLTAHAKLSGDLPILPGPARLFLEDDYVGDTRLDTIEPGNPITIGFGRDRRLVVRRERRHRRNTTVEKDRRQLREWYEITVRSRIARTVTVEVQDRLPTVPDPEVNVSREEEGTPSESLRSGDPKDLIRWVLKLPKRGRRRIHFGYRITYPSGRRLVGI